MLPSAPTSMFRRVAWKSIVTWSPGLMMRTVALAGGTPASVDGLPTSEAYCAMLHVSAAGSVGVAGGAGVAAGGSVVVVVDAVVVSVDAVVAGSSAGVHAISATPTKMRSDAFFMAKESRPCPTSDKHAPA
jgi:hypothetical protein